MIWWGGNLPVAQKDRKKGLGEKLQNLGRLYGQPWTHELMSIG